MNVWEPRVVILGGIGSGKSTVRRTFESLGFVGIDSDRVGHAVLSSEGLALEAVAARWPESYVDGRIDRQKLGTIVFSDRHELAELERITHPHIFGMIEREVERVDASVVVELPVLNHSFGPPWIKVVVDAEDAVRLARAIDRGATAQDVRARMALQPRREAWLAAGDCVIPNHGSLEELIETTEHLVALLNG